MLFRTIIRLSVLGVVAGAVAGEPGVKGKTDADKQARHLAAQAEFFRGPIPTIRLEIADEEMKALRDDPRRYVEARMVVGDKTYKGVAVKLKGAQGSFRPIDQKPAWTVNLDQFKGAERFHGQKKFHLNNAMEDPSFLHQLLCGEMARAAGVPAIRCTHAFVQLNERDLGLYVFTESYTKDFLAPFFKNVDGDLYESGFIKDIDEDLSKDHGDPKDFRAIDQLLAACREEDPTVCWTKLGAILDVDKFASVLAIEALLGVGDGYDFGRNNYRIYHDPVTKRLSFIPHGMDEPLAEPDFDVQRSPQSIVGKAYVRCPEGRALYRERVGTLYEKVFAKRDWVGRAGEVEAKVCEAFEARDPESAKELAVRMDAVRQQVGERVKRIATQLAELPERLIFDKNGAVKVTKGWGTKYEDGAKLERTTADGQPALLIAAEGETQASWRTGAALPRGHYRFEARVKTRGVEGEGVGLRISGQEPKTERVSGDVSWKSLSYEFDVPEEERDVVLVAEMRGTKGEAWFALDSLRLVRAGRAVTLEAKN